MVELAYHINEENVLYAMNLHIYVFSFIFLQRKVQREELKLSFETRSLGHSPNLI